MVEKQIDSGPHIPHRDISIDLDQSESIESTQQEFPKTNWAGVW